MPDPQPDCAEHEDPLLPDEEWVSVPPDGGWGWLVLGGTLLVSMLIPGTIKSFGILFVEFLEVFDASPVAASWIPALCYFLYCSLGPLSSYLCRKTSYRTVTIIGGLFAASGMILSYFATSILFLCFSYGIMVGTGAGLSYPPGIFIVTSYFVKLRGLANGLAVSGSAFGSIILPPFLSFLLDHFGYRGATLIMGALTLNVLVGALLYQPVELHMKRIKVKKEYPEGEELKEKLPLDEKPKNGLDEKLKNGYNGPEPKIIISRPSVEETKIKLSDIKVSKIQGDVLKPGEKRILEVGRGWKDETIVIKKGSHQPLLEISDSKSRKVSTPARFLTSSKDGVERRRKISEWPRGDRHIAAGSVSYLGPSRKYSMGSTTSSFRYVSTAWHGSTLIGLNPELTSTTTLATKTDTATSATPCCSGCGSVFDLIKTPLFIVLLLANATSAIGYTNFIILIPSYAGELGFTKSQGTMLLSIVAAADLVGRVGGAALSDWLSVDKCVYFFGGLLVSGVSLALIPFVSAYWAVAFLCAVFGVSSGSYIGITAVIMVDLLGEELLQSSYGLSLFVNGVLQLIGPPICGVVYVTIHQYGPIFVSLGLTLVCGGAGWIAIPFVHKRKS